MTKIVSGGGINSNKTVQSKKVKSEPISHKGNVAGVAQQGMAVQFKREPITQGKGYETKPMGGTGIGRATTRPDTPGPGSGRTTYGCGSQGTYGKPVAGEVNRAPDPPATAPGKDILSGYGPERRR